MPYQVRYINGNTDIAMSPLVDTIKELRRAIKKAEQDMMRTWAKPDPNNLKTVIVILK